MYTALDRAPFRVHQTLTSLRFEDEHGRELRVFLEDDSYRVESLRTRYRYPLTQKGAHAARSRLHDRVGYLARTALQRRARPHRPSSPPPVDDTFSMLGWRGAHKLFEDRFVRQIVLAYPDLNPIVTRMEGERLSVTPVIFSAAFRREAYLQRDALRFRAARVAISGSEAWGHERLAYTEDEKRDVEPHQIVARLLNWRALYCPERKGYRALYQTLDEMDAHIGVDWFATLRCCRLPRKIPSLLHFRVTREMVRSNQHRAQNLTPILARIYVADETEINAAISLIWWQIFRGSPHSYQMAMHTFAEFLLREPIPRGFSLTAGAERYLARMLNEARQAPAVTGSCHRPPIPLPENPSIRFLAHVSDILAESRDMHHCVATYASAAVRGDCFLFHVDYEDEKATVEVSKDGSLRQSYGPRNVTNRAARYGRERLSRWSKGFWVTQVGGMEQRLSQATEEMNIAAQERVHTVGELYSLWLASGGEEKESEDLEDKWLSPTRAALQGRVILRKECDGESVRVVPISMDAEEVQLGR